MINYYTLAKISFILIILLNQERLDNHFILIYQSILEK